MKKTYIFTTPFTRTLFVLLSVCVLCIAMGLHLTVAAATESTVNITDFDLNTDGYVNEMDVEIIKTHIYDGSDQYHMCDLVAASKLVEEDNWTSFVLNVDVVYPDGVMLLANAAATETFKVVSKGSILYLESEAYKTRFEVLSEDVLWGVHLGDYVCGFEDEGTQANVFVDEETGRFTLCRTPREIPAVAAMSFLKPVDYWSVEVLDGYFMGGMLHMDYQIIDDRLILMMDDNVVEVEIDIPLLDKVVHPTDCSTVCLCIQQDVFEIYSSEVGPGLYQVWGRLII